MPSDNLRALVVDDEALVRNLTVRALSGEGFRCDHAEDGIEAQQMLDDNCYDVMVTDLRMPNRNGHALASEVLGCSDRPAVVVLTGVLEPKLAKDLIARGAEHVEFKPVNYPLFAAKVRALVDRRQANVEGHGRRREHGGDSGESPSLAKQNGDASSTSTIEASEIERKLSHLSKILPVSQAAFDVFNMTSSNSYDAETVAAAMARDGSLSVDVLRLANSAFYNASGQQVVELEEAVVRLGQKRVGELALATSALAAMTANVFSWMNVDLAWRRSIAAGVAVDLLLATGKHRDAETGLFLSAILHPLGRIALGMLYPHQYQEMVNVCREEGETLAERETRLFPLNPAGVMESLLKAWNIPPAICQPLKHITDPYASLARLSDPLRSKAELLKIGVLIGRIAVGEWEPWDRLEFPPAPVLQRLGLESLPEIIQATKADSEEIIGFRSEFTAPRRTSGDRKKPESPSRRLAYCNLSPEPFDFLAEIVPSMGIRLQSLAPDAIDPDENVLINSIWALPYKLAARVSPGVGGGTKLIVTDTQRQEPYSRFGRVLALPGSYGALRQACAEVAQAFPTLPPVEMTSTVSSGSFDLKA